MNALAVIGTTVGGAVIGGGIGFWVGMKDGGDFNIAPAIFGPLGAVIGGFAGVVVGAIAFAR